MTDAESLHRWLEQGPASRVTRNAALGVFDRGYWHLGPLTLARGRPWRPVLSLWLYALRGPSHLLGTGDYDFTTAQLPTPVWPPPSPRSPTVPSPDDPYEPHVCIALDRVLTEPLDPGWRTQVQPWIEAVATLEPIRAQLVGDEPAAWSLRAAPAAIFFALHDAAGARTWAERTIHGADAVTRAEVRNQLEGCGFDIAWLPPIDDPVAEHDAKHGRGSHRAAELERAEQALEAAGRPDPNPAPGETTLVAVDRGMVVELAWRTGTRFVSARHAVFDALVRCVPGAVRAAEVAGLLAVELADGSTRSGDDLDPWLDAVFDHAAQALDRGVADDPATEG